MARFSGRPPLVFTRRSRRLGVMSGRGAPVSARMYTFVLDGKAPLN
jgi:hypothetical protein